MQPSKKAVIYVRVSTKEQVDEGNSLVTQEKICREYAIKNGFEIERVFKEQGESAKNINRTELWKMMDYCSLKKNGIIAVIAYKVDRIARNIDDYRHIRIRLKTHGVEIISTSEFFEDTPAGRFMENIIANVAQFDNDVRTERSINGMRDAAREGRYVWSASIGYSNVRVAGKPNIAPNEKAILVQKAFEKVAQNISPIDTIWKELVKEGLVIKSGKPYTRSAFYRMLKNPVYIGLIIKFGETHKGIYQPIISEELFNAVQLVLRNRKRSSITYKVKNPDFPLRRFFIHPDGRKLTGAWAQGRNKKYAYYRYHYPLCHELKKENVENIFREFLDTYEFKQEHFAELRKGVEKNLIKENEENIKQSKRGQQRITELKEKQRSLIDKNLQGYISNELLKDQLLEIDIAIRDISVSILVLESTNTLDLEHAFETVVKPFLLRPSKIWDEAPFEVKQELQWFNFPKGIIFDGVHCRTTEVCNLFKTKDLFLPSLSSRVHFKNKELNQIQNNPLVTKKSLYKNSKSGNPEDPDYWQKVGYEIIKLSEILKKFEAK